MKDGNIQLHKSSHNKNGNLKTIYKAKIKIHEENKNNLKNIARFL